MSLEGLKLMLVGPFWLAFWLLSVGFALIMFPSFALKPQKLEKFRNASLSSRNPEAPGTRRSAA